MFMCFFFVSVTGSWKWPIDIYKQNFEASISFTSAEEVKMVMSTLKWCVADASPKISILFCLLLLGIVLGQN